MHSRRLVFISFILIFFLGCKPAIIESNVRSGYTKKLDKVYVLMTTTDSNGESFFYKLDPELSSKLTTCSVKNMIHVYKNLGLDEKKTIANELKEFDPNFILTIQLTSRRFTIFSNGFSHSRPAPSGATFELILQEADKEDIVWKAMLETSGSSYYTAFSSGGTLGKPEATVAEIINCLHKDGLLTVPPTTSR